MICSQITNLVGMEEVGDMNRVRICVKMGQTLVHLLGEKVHSRVAIECRGNRVLEIPLLRQRQVAFLWFAQPAGQIWMQGQIN